MAEASSQEMSSLREQGCWWLKFKRVLNDVYSQLCAVSMKPGGACAAPIILTASCVLTLLASVT